MPFSEDIEIEGYSSFLEKIKELEKSSDKKPLFILFTGSETEDGKSWCPDCVQFESMWSTLKTKFSPDEGTLVRVKVGARDYWKDKECPFRTDRKTALSSIPTLVRWGTPQRLSDDDIMKADLVQMLMEDD